MQDEVRIRTPLRSCGTLSVALYGGPWERAGFGELQIPVFIDADGPFVQHAIELPTFCEERPFALYESGGLGHYYFMGFVDKQGNRLDTVS